MDLLYEIMLRLPTQPVCRFRAVCRSWRFLLCHPEFIAAAHNPGPLLAIGVNDDYYLSNQLNVVDMESGDVVERLNVASNNAEVCRLNHDRVVCVPDPFIKVIRLIDLDNDAVFRLPRPSIYSTWCIVGRAAAIGNHKVLAIDILEQPQVCKILTLGNNDHSWRDAGHPPLKVVRHAGSFAVINGFAFFICDYRSSSELIMVFDLSCETWLPATSLRGPPILRWVSLAELNGHLVACCICHLTLIEMWFLEDLHRSQWSKRYTITIPYYQNLFSATCHVYFVKPLAVLDDGRLVLWMRVFGISIHQNEVLWIYDPQTKTFMYGTKLPKCRTISVFAWNLLRSGRRSAIDMAAERLLIRRRH
jgi:F-box interacting protein